MSGKLVVGLGAFGAALLTAGCLGMSEDREIATPQATESETYDQPEVLQEPGYRIVPRPRPASRAASNVRGSTNAKDKDADASKKIAKTETPPSESKAKTPVETGELPKTADIRPPVAKTAEIGPVTPAEIRTAVPVQKLDNPKQALSGVEVKSVWGGVLGRVSSLDVSSGKLKTLNISVQASPGRKSKVVRVEPSRMKYMPNRKMVLTTLSKPDLEKLPATSNP